MNMVSWYLKCKVMKILGRGAWFNKKVTSEGTLRVKKLARKGAKSQGANDFFKAAIFRD